MATKKDLLEAQKYSRNRLLTAFTSGIPGGIELEPRNPWTAVVFGMVLTALLVAGSVIFGMIRPGLPQGWQNGRLLISQDTGARYVSQKGVLYPVINATSARLMIPSDQFAVVSVSEDKLHDVPRGQTIGILGAPDTLPGVDELNGTGWTSCVVSGRTITVVDRTRTAVAVGADEAMLASQDGHAYVIRGSRRFAVPDDAATRAAVLRVVGMQNTTAVPVSAEWLNLFDKGTDLEPARVPGAGDQVQTSAGPLTVGQVVSAEGGASHRFVVMPDGTLARLSATGFSLYGLGNPVGLATPRQLGAEQMSGLGNAPEPIGGTDWPTGDLHGIDWAGTRPCVTLQGSDGGGVPVPQLAQAVRVSALDDDVQKGESAVLPPSGGALVRAVGAGQKSVGVVNVIDSSGRAYPVPDATNETIKRLGYTAHEVSPVPAAWLSLFATGPKLTAAAAARPPDSSAASASSGGAQSLPDATGSGTDAGASSSDPSTGAEPQAATDDQSCTPDSISYDTAVPAGLTQMQGSQTGALATGRGVTVAVVDSGVDFGNAHLQGASAGGVNLVPDGTAADGSTDLYGHGTAVAGIIAARQVQGSGVAGLAPDARILSVRVYRSTDDQSKQAGFGPSVPRIAQGIRYAADHGASVINVSLSDSSGSGELADAVAYATDRGALVVASAGNVDTTGGAQSGPSLEARYPAAYPQALGVTGLDARLLASDQEVHGPQVGVSAPGMNVLTAAAGAGDCMYAAKAPSSSFATAYTSAAAALVAQEFPTDGPDQWKYRLQLTAVRADPDNRDDVHGWGIVRPVEALSAVIGNGVRGPFQEGIAPFRPSQGRVTQLTTDGWTDPMATVRRVVLWTGTLGGSALAVLLLVAWARRQRADRAAAERPGA
jgi:type VII secretion protein EccB